MNMQLLTKPARHPDPSIEEIILAAPPATTDFRVDTPDKASWAARKLLDAESRITRRTALAKEYKGRIDSWLERANKEDAESVDYLKGILRPYADLAVATQRTSRSVHLPGAVLSLRKKPDRVDVTEPDIAISYCETEHPEAVVIKKDVSKSVLKALLSRGTDIPGCRLESGRDELYVKPE